MAPTCTRATYASSRTNCPRSERRAERPKGHGTCGAGARGGEGRGRRLRVSTPARGARRETQTQPARAHASRSGRAQGWRPRLRSTPLDLTSTASDRTTPPLRETFSCLLWRRMRSDGCSMCRSLRCTARELTRRDLRIGSKYLVCVATLSHTVGAAAPSVKGVRYSVPHRYIM